VATAYVLPPDDVWSSRQLLLAALEALGYRVEMIGAGDRWLLYLVGFSGPGDRNPFLTPYGA
jgi:hypothetical protein